MVMVMAMMAAIASGIGTQWKANGKSNNRLAIVGPAVVVCQTEHWRTSPFAFEATKMQIKTLRTVVTVVQCHVKE